MITQTIKEDISEILSNFESSLKEFNGKTILITGANGLIPSYLVDLLVENNKSLVQPTTLLLINKNPITPESRLSHLINNPHVEFIQQDVGLPFSLPYGIDYIFHGASRANPQAVKENPLDTIDANISGIRTLLDYAKSNKVEKFVVFSSFEIYGNIPDENTKISESFLGQVDTLNEIAPYNESKRFSETLAMTYHRLYQTAIYIPRILLAYGPGMRNDGKIITDYVFASLSDKKILIRNDGMSRRSFCYISDIISGLLTIIFNGTPGEAYNLGNDSENITIKQLAEIIAQVTDNGTTIDLNLSKPGVSNRFPDISKLKSLGFSPKINLKSGLIKLIKHIKELEKLEEN
jgi:UDP-glucuronate decarboxylase